MPNIFLTKYDTSGSVLWAKSYGGSGNAKAYSVTTDLSGNGYLTGAFQSPAITFGATTLTIADTSGNYNMFLVKYNPAGDLIWAQGAGGMFSDVSNAVATDLSGNVYITGSFSSPKLTFGSTVLTISGITDIFVAKCEDISLSAPTIRPNAGFLLFPNPVASELTIISPQPVNQIVITNMLGQTILSSSYYQTQFVVDVSDLAPGVYFVRANGAEMRKFVKQ